MPLDFLPGSLLPDPRCSPKGYFGIFHHQAVGSVHFEQLNPLVENPLKYYVTCRGCYALL